jgi:hypothetical protein
VRRREFIARLGGAATAWPLGVRAQQCEQMRRIGLLARGAESDRIIQARIVAFRGGGWVEECILRIDLSFGNVDAGKFQ